MRTFLVLLALATGNLAAAAEDGPVTVRHAVGALHGFPSMSDAAGRVIADGELTQELTGERLSVTARWVFADGHRAEEHDAFAVGRELVQESYSWTETLKGEELRRLEVDLRTGKAVAVTRGEGGERKRETAQLELTRGRSFAGYGVALAASELSLKAGGKAELTLVAFTPKPRTVTLEVRREGEERIAVAGRPIRCDRYTLHPAIPALLKPFVGAKDAHLWLTHAAPPALVRAEQNLAEKDDPVVVIDVTPRGPAHASAARSPRSGAVRPPASARPER